MEKTKQKKIIEQELGKYQRPMATMFYVFFAIIFIYDYLSSSMMFIPFENMILKGILWLPYDLIEPAFKLILNLRHLIIIPAVYTIICEVRDRKRQVILAALLLVGWFYAIYWREIEDYAVFSPLLVIVACANRDIKKIIKIAIVSGTSVIALAFVLSQMGIIEDLVWQRPGIGMPDRHAFGMNYCTDLVSHVMFLIFLYMFLKRGRLKLTEYVVIGVLSVINILFVDGKIALICTVFALGGCIFVTLYDKKQWKIPDGLMHIWDALMVSSYIIGAAILFGWVFIYKTDPDIWYNRYYSLENRLHTNYRLLTQIPFSWFGTNFVQMGFGGKAEMPEYYFWVDCSYPRVYAMNGIVAFVVFMAILTWIVIRLKKRKLYFGMFLMAVIALDCMIEHHMIEIAYNTFLVCAFANLDTIIEKKARTVSGV